MNGVNEVSLTDTFEIESPINNILSYLVSFNSNFLIDHDYFRNHFSTVLTVIISPNLLCEYGSECWYVCVTDLRLGRKYIGRDEK